MKSILLRKLAIDIKSCASAHVSWAGIFGFKNPSGTQELLSIIQWEEMHLQGYNITERAY